MRAPTETSESVKVDFPWYLPHSELTQVAVDQLRVQAGVYDDHSARSDPDGQGIALASAAHHNQQVARRRPRMAGL